MKRFAHVLVVVLLVFLFSCSGGGSGGGDGGDDAGGDTGDTSDITAPTVLSTYPVDGDVNIDDSADISVTFSEEMDQSTITSSSFTLTGPVSAAVDGVVTYSGTTAIFTPTSSLDTSTEYTAHLLIAITDIAGNALAAEYSWDFTTSAAVSDTQILSIESMALILDTSGSPIANAVISEGVLTDEKGVATGAFNTSSTGWAAVSAAGYMNGYMAAGVSKAGVDLYEIRLAPLEAMVGLTDGSTATLLIGSEDAPAYSAELTAASFDSTPVYVGIASLKPIDIDPLFEALSTDADVSLKLAFGLVALDNTQMPVVMKNDGDIDIRIKDEGVLSDDAILAYFDPDDGQWEVVPGGCTRDGLDHFSCSLNVVSPLYGLFDSDPPDYLNKALYHRAAATEGDLGEAYKEAKQRYIGRLKELEEICAGNPDCDATNDAELNQALEDMAEAARNYAKDNMNENGKFALFIAAQHSTLSGNASLGQDLFKDAADIAEDIGNKLLNDIRCERLREILNSAQQNMLMGNEVMASQLIEKAGKDLKDCDIWVGNITYWFPIDSTHPCTDNFDYMAGGMWQEIHDVRMTTNATSYILTGEDNVRLNFPEVTFRREDECEQSIKMFGKPSSGKIYLTFDGTYNGYEFNVNNPGQAGQTISIGQEQIMEAEKDDVCQSMPPYPLTLDSPNFSSVLVHGFFDSPPITIQEMLEEGSRSVSGMERISGEETLTNECDATGFARYPFSEGTVLWKFTHIQKILPIEEE